MDEIAFSIAAVPPFRLDLTATALQRRPINAIDRWDGRAYSRVLAVSGRRIFVEVRQSGLSRTPRLRIRAVGRKLPTDAKPKIADTLRKLLGLQLDLQPFYRFARAEPRLYEISQRFLGLKPPRFASVFEAMANGIACQQLSLHVGLTLLNRLAARTGQPCATAAGARFAFPDAQDIAKLPVRTFRSLGFSTNKALALKRLASSIEDGAFDPESLADLSNDQAEDRLLALRGVGPWTAEYVLLRGLGRIDVFPSADVGGMANLARWLGMKTRPDAARMEQLGRKWHPYFGLIYFHLLLDSLQSAHA